MTALDATFEASVSALVELDASGGVVRANELAARLFGRSVEAFAGVAFNALFGDEPPFVPASTIVRREVASPRPLLVTLVPMHEGATVRGYVASLGDATTSDLRERTLERAEVGLRAMMERSPDPMVIHRQGRVVYANPGVALLLGYGAAEEMQGLSVIEITAPDDRAVVRERIERMLTRHEPVPLNDERFLRRDGTTIHVEVVALPMVFEGQLSVLVFGHDLTERRRSEAERQRLLDEQQRLRAQAQQRAAELRAILDHLPSGLVVSDAVGRVTLWNEALAKLFGRAPAGLGETVGHLFGDANPRRADGRALTEDELPSVRALGGEEVDLLDLTLRLTSDVDRSLRVSSAPIRDEHGQVTGAVTVLRDVTELVEFDRLKDQFLRVVAHELKTPVAIMKGYAQLLLRCDDDRLAASRPTLEKIDRGADRIDRIVRDMLYLSQLHLGHVSLDHRPVRLDELVGGVARDFVSTIERHRLELELSPALVDGDAARLQEVVRRLVDNAVRYSPNGGRVVVRLVIEDGRAVVQVEDEGVGIPAAKQGRLFERFYRAHADTPNDYGGMGVGLHIAREIVRRHGGEMWFESREGQGSVFSFGLPLSTTR